MPAGHLEQSQSTRSAACWILVREVTPAQGSFGTSGSRT